VTDADPDRTSFIEVLATREVTDPVTGIRWLVHEVRDIRYDRRAAPSLIFTSDEAMRRVRTYPENWMTLDVAELLRVSTGT
jgi:hypothetical protein